MRKIYGGVKHSSRNREVVMFYFCLGLLPSFQAYRPIKNCVLKPLSIKKEIVLSNLIYMVLTYSGCAWGKRTLSS